MTALHLIIKMRKQITYFITSFLIVTLASIYFSSCGSADVIITNYPPAEPVDTSTFEYPFTIGSYWNYSVTHSAENIRPDSIRHYFSTYPFTGSGHNEIMYDTVVLIGGPVRVISDRTILQNDTLGSRFYYTNSSNSMVCYGYRGGTSASFPYSVQPAIRFGTAGKLFSSFNELRNFVCGEQTVSSVLNDTFIVESPVTVVLKYTVIRGTEWIFKDFGSDHISKKYLSFENYHLDTSVISCIKTQRINTFNNDYILYDYYSKYGQMKKDYLFKNIQVHNQFGNTIGYVDMRELYSVTSFSIAP